MVNLQLTNKEWYFLHTQIKKVIKEVPHNYIAKGILEKLAENRPLLSDIKYEFQREYDCVWIGREEDGK